MNRKLAETRIRTLREAIDVLRALAPEMSAHRLRLESGEKMLRRIAIDYERIVNDHIELEEAERKPPQRVLASGRRKRAARSSAYVSPNDAALIDRAEKHLREAPMDNSNLDEENEG